MFFSCGLLCESSYTAVGKANMLYLVWYVHVRTGVSKQRELANKTSYFKLCPVIYTEISCKTKH